MLSNLSFSYIISKKRLHSLTMYFKIFILIVTLFDTCLLQIFVMQSTVKCQTNIVVNMGIIYMLVQI